METGRKSIQTSSALIPYTETCDTGLIVKIKRVVFPRFQFGAFRRALAQQARTNRGLTNNSYWSVRLTAAKAFKQYQTPTEKKYPFGWGSVPRRDFCSYSRWTSAVRLRQRKNVDNLTYHSTRYFRFYFFRILYVYIYLGSYTFVTSTVWGIQRSSRVQNPSNIVLSLLFA